MSNFTEMRDRARSSPKYWERLLVRRFTNELRRVMKSQSVNQKELARLAKKTPARVSQVLSGHDNLSIEKMAEYAHALGAAVHLHIAPQGKIVRWREDNWRNNPVTTSGMLWRSPHTPTIVTESQGTPQ